MEKAQKQVTRSVQFPPSVLEELDRIARKQHCSVAAVVREAIDYWLFHRGD